MNFTLYETLKKKITEKEYYEDIYQIPWELYNEKKHTITKDDYKHLKIGLFNIPCNGFGDVITCHKFYEYLKQWYPGIDVTIYTTTKEKFEMLGVKGDIIDLLINNKNVTFDDDDGGDKCVSLWQTKFKNKKSIPELDLIIQIPLVNDNEGTIEDIKDLLPYANKFNSFTFSEYNGSFGDICIFPTGIGEDNLGLLLSDKKVKPQRLLQNPYTLIYIQNYEQYMIPQLHGVLCILSYLEMICHKYYNVYNELDVIIPEWVVKRMNSYDINFLTRLKQSTSKYDNLVYINHNKEEIYLRTDQKYYDGRTLYLRGDILPQKQDIFRSLIKGSIPDLLLTGDQSLTDGLSYCSNSTNIWYQVVSWKQDFAEELSKEIPNKFLSNYKTSCGTLKGIRFHKNNKSLKQKWDFRKLGRQRMDSLLLSRRLLKDPIAVIFMYLTEHSNSKEILLKKFEKEIMKN